MTVDQLADFLMQKIDGSIAATSFDRTYAIAGHIDCEELAREIMELLNVEVDA